MAADHRKLAAAELTRRYWEEQRPAVIRWLITERRFNPKGAETAARSFIDTMVFVASETGEPQFNLRPPAPAPQSAHGAGNE